MENKKSKDSQVHIDKKEQGLFKRFMAWLAKGVEESQKARADCRT